LPISDALRDILQAIPKKPDRDFVFGYGNGGFNSWSKCKERLDEAAPIKPWVVHDLRRTVKTGMGKLSVSPHISEAVLNHLPPKLVRTYDANTYEAEKRAALEKWGAHVLKITSKYKRAA